MGCLQSKSGDISGNINRFEMELASGFQGDIFRSRRQNSVCGEHQQDARTARFIPTQRFPAGIYNHRINRSGRLTQDITHTTSSRNDRENRSAQDQNDAQNVAPTQNRSTPGCRLSSGYGSSCSLDQRPSTSFDPTDDWYRMTYGHRGYCIVFNYTHIRGNPRDGTDKDIESLNDCFHCLNFFVDIQTNCTSKAVKRTIRKYTSLDLKAVDCFAVVILSHGDAEKFETSDGHMKIEDIIKSVKQCEDLLGKPKLFFIQACRGDRADRNVSPRLIPDASPDSSGEKFSQNADIVVSYATAKGYFAYRNPNTGSIYIQRLTQYLKEYGPIISFLDVLTYVNCAVAYDFQETEETQAPIFQSSLRKKLRFPTVVRNIILCRQELSDGSIIQHPIDTSETYI